MIAGRVERFAIEAEINKIIDDWVFGHFRFWLFNEPVGDWQDSAALNGCANWLRDFAKGTKDRFEAGLFEKSPADVFRLVYDPIFVASAPESTIDNAYRFYISNMGMSSFERFDLLLLKDKLGNERCLWREAGLDMIHDCHLRPNEMEQVAEEFVKMFEIERDLQKPGVNDNR